MFHFVNLILATVLSLSAPPQVDYTLVIGNNSAGTQGVISCVNKSLVETSTAVLPNSGTIVSSNGLINNCVIDFSTPISARKAYVAYQDVTLSNTIVLCKYDITSGNLVMDPSYPLYLTMGNGIVDDMGITPTSSKLVISTNSGTVAHIVDVSSFPPTVTPITGLANAGLSFVPLNGRVVVESNNTAWIAGGDSLVGLPYNINVVNLTTAATTSILPVYGLSVPANQQAIGELTVLGGVGYVSTGVTGITAFAYGFTAASPLLGSFNIPMYFITGFGAVNWASWKQLEVFSTGQFVYFPGANAVLNSGIGPNFDVFNNTVNGGFNLTPYSKGKGVFIHSTGVYVSFETTSPAITHQLTRYNGSTTTWPTASPSWVLKTWKLDTAKIVSYDSYFKAAVSQFDPATNTYTVGPNTSCLGGIEHLYPYDSY